MCFDMSRAESETARQRPRARRSDSCASCSYSLAAPMAEPMKFAVRYAGLSLKITLDEKWQGRALLTAVVVPFVRSFNKKRPDYDAVHEDGLIGQFLTPVQDQRIRKSM